MEHIDILIIDDEEKFAAMLAKRIELRGCHTKVCHDGKTALQWIENHLGSITLILLDLQLPDMYGTQVLKCIKKINPAIPVAIMTGHGSEKDQKESELLGAFKFMHKPIDIGKLMTILEHIREMASD
jgi:DNA-binding NtrC family response regulator